MPLSFAFRLLLACCLITFCSCSRTDSEEVARLKKELDAAKAEAAAAKAELVQLKSLTKKDDPNQSTQPDPEVKFAQAVAEEFLGHAIRNAPAAALQLGTPEFQKRFGELHLQYVPVPDEKRSKGSAFGISAFDFSGVAIKSGELSSGKETAMFKGELHPPKGLLPIVDPYPTHVSFSLRLVKEKTSGKWKVDGFDLQ
jgi:hypothetical protein